MSNDTNIFNLNHLEVLSNQPGYDKFIKAITKEEHYSPIMFFVTDGDNWNIDNIVGVFKEDNSSRIYVHNVSDAATGTKYFFWGEYDNIQVFFGELYKSYGDKIKFKFILPGYKRKVNDIIYRTILFDKTPDDYGKFYNDKVYLIDDKDRLIMVNNCFNDYDGITYSYEIKKVNLLIKHIKMTIEINKGYVTHYIDMKSGKSKIYKIRYKNIYELIRSIVEDYFRYDISELLGKLYKYDNEYCEDNVHSLINVIKKITVVETKSIDHVKCDDFIYTGEVKRLVEIHPIVEKDFTARYIFKDTCCLSYLKPIL